MRLVVQKSNIVIGALYEHYKGKKYKVIGLAKHSETLEDLVVYQGQYNSEEFGNNPIWVRPLASFISLVEGKNIPRFKLLD